MFKPPLSIQTGYLTVPSFLADHIIKMTDSGELRQTVMEPFDTKHSTYPFSEICLTDEDGDAYPSIIKKLIDREIPFHFNYTYAEDVEVDYWFMLEPEKEGKKIQGSCVGAKPKDKDKLVIDFVYLNRVVGNILAQYRLLGEDAKALFEVREINDFQFN